VAMAEGKTVGIVGYGDIGKAIAARVRPLGMKVLALKRTTVKAGEKDPFVEKFFGPGQRIEMISRSDYIAIATPLTPETRGLIGETEFAAMKPTAVVINVGRGPVIDEAALVRALQEKRIKARRSTSLTASHCLPAIPSIRWKMFYSLRIAPITRRIGSKPRWIFSSSSSSGFARANRCST